jgi:hypothetical protein
VPVQIERKRQPADAAADDCNAGCLAHQILNGVV